MKKRKYVHPDNLQPRSPALATMVYLLMLDRFNAPAWLWGVVGTLIVLAWFVYVFWMCNSESVPLFKDHGEQQ